jgi:pimeloyl-ACP methyl ester carboxylesterase
MRNIEILTLLPIIKFEREKMKCCISNQTKVLKWLVISMMSCTQIQTLANTNPPLLSIVDFTVKTYDGLELPAQVIRSSQSPKKVLIFIMGGTPCDQKGNMGGSWDANCVSEAEPYDFYIRFLKTMPAKGYAVATMAKRNFVYPCNIPRPCLNDFARDIHSLIAELKERKLLRSEDDLILVGHSEGSIVATKVLPLLKRQPSACVLLGSGSLAFDFKKQSWENWYFVDHMRRVSGMSDEQIQQVFNLFKKIDKELPTIDEKTFENQWKKDAYPVDFAPWESYNCLMEFHHYDPVPNLLASNVPVLICIGQNDGAMPMVLAERTYKHLKQYGFKKASFKVIKGEVHQYKRYDAFAIMNAWIDSGYRSVAFVLDEQDKQIIANWKASVDQIARAINELPWQDGAPEKALECFRKAKDANYQKQDPWFKLGLVLFGSAHYEESMYSFKKTTDPDFIACFASMTWIGHINDILNHRQEAISWYKKALAHDQGFPVQHDNWGIVIDTEWIEERLKTPFTGIK